MKKHRPDCHSFLLDEINGVKIKFWYLISEPEPEVGYNEAYMESCYITNLDGSPCPELNISDEEFDRLKDLAFEPEDDSP